MDSWSSGYCDWLWRTCSWDDTWLPARMVYLGEYHRQSRYRVSQKGTCTCMYVIFICKTHLSHACDCVHHSCASVHVNDCASVHVHVHGCDHDHGCVSVHDLSIKMQVQYIIYINLLVTRKQFLWYFKKEGVRGGGGGSGSRRPTLLPSNCFRINCWNNKS